MFLNKGGVEMNVIVKKDLVCRCKECKGYLVWGGGFIQKKYLCKEDLKIIQESKKENIVCGPCKSIAYMLLSKSVN